MKHSLLITVFAVLLGCASLRPVPIETITKLPTVRVGGQPPAHAEYVVFYPAGYAFAIKVKVKGSLFSAEKHIESQVTLAKDLYLYKYWASHDRITWKNSHQLLGVEFGGGLDVSGVQVNVKLEAK